MLGLCCRMRRARGAVRTGLKYQYVLPIRSVPASHLFLQGNFRAFHLDHKLVRGEVVGEDMCMEEG